ncbi:MAG: tetratricopeptide repeat protein [Polyangiaceae bacterium]
MGFRDSGHGAMASGERGQDPRESGIRAAVPERQVFGEDDATDPAISMPGDFWSETGWEPETETETVGADAGRSVLDPSQQTPDVSLSIFPIFEDGTTALAWLTQRRVIGRITKEIEQRPDDPSLYLERSAAHVALGSPREAIEDCARALSMKPDFARAYVARAGICFELGAHLDCVVDCSRALRIDRGRVDALRQRAAARAALGEHAAAIHDYDEAILLSPGTAALFKDRGEMKGRLGDFAGALDDLNVAVAMAPADDDALFRRNVVRALVHDGPAADWGKATQRVLAAMAERQPREDGGRVA